MLPFLGQIPAKGLADAGVPAELAGKQHQAHQYLTQKLSGGASRRQVMVMTLGYEGSGKSSVVWRLRNPDLESLMPSLNSTDGISTCTTQALLLLLLLLLQACPLTDSPFTPRPLRPLRL